MAQVDTFLKLGDIVGESVNKNHKEWIDILSWSWGATNSGYFHRGGGGGSGKVQVNDLHITKWIDKSSADVMLKVMNGAHYPEAKLVCRKADGENSLDYLTITMTDVRVTSYNSGGSGGADAITENVSLNFAKVKVEYKMQDKAGKSAKGGDMTWDIAQNVKG